MNSDDPFSPDKLRLVRGVSPEAESLAVVPVTRPNSQVFFRVHPEPDWQLETLMIQLKEPRGPELYLVEQQLWSVLADDLKPKVLYTCVAKTGELFVWPINAPGGDGWLDDWSRSAQEVARLAQTGWVRLVPDHRLKAYTAVRGSPDLPPPEWPETSFVEVIKVAFKDRLVQSLDHPVVHRLRGTV